MSRTLNRQACLLVLPLLTLTTVLACARDDTRTLTTRPAKEGDLLAEGPDAVRICWRRDGGKEVVEKGLLCLLKKDRLWWRNKSGWLEKYERRKGHVRWVEIETGDKKYRWDWNEKERIFEGDPRLPEPIELTPLGTDINADKFLFYALEQLLKDLESPLLDETQLDIIKDAAVKYKSKLARKPGQKELCESLLALAEERRKRDERLEEITRAQIKNQRGLLNKIRQEELQIALERFEGLNVDSLEAFFLSGLLSGGKACVRGAQLREYAILRSYERTADWLERMEAAWQAYQTAVETQWGAVLKAGHKDFRRPSPKDADDQRKLLAALRDKGDRDQLSKLFDQMSRNEPDNPFLRADACLARAHLPAPQLNKAERAERILKDSEGMPSRRPNGAVGGRLCSGAADTARSGGPPRLRGRGR